MTDLKYTSSPQNIVRKSSVCFHAKLVKLSVMKLRDRMGILWKCRRCSRILREVIEIDVNSKELYVKSSRVVLPRTMSLVENE